MAIRRTLAQFSDEIVAADIAANAVGASELADNAVDTAAIADDAITNAKIGAAAVGATEIAADAVGESQLSVDFTTVKPHIQPGVLQPAVAGKLLNGANHSGAYGTAQSQSGGDGHKYYYTDIKGSKPIKDPRIGAHFGSQRYKFKSLQLLEQETATHGDNTYSIDGREWIRIVGNVGFFSNNYGTHGSFISSDEGGSVASDWFIEIVGYFNDFNTISNTTTAKNDDINVTINGGSVRNSTNTDKLGGRSAINSVLRGRYVDSGSVINHGDSDVASDLGTAPKLNTLKIEPVTTSGEYWDFYGIELITQDTTSAATKSQIQIPSQNVVSYGKKFTVAAETKHYNPFAFAGDGTTAVAIGNTTSHGKVATGWTGSTSAYFDSTLDTATSLGLSAWETGGDFYRPVNGGRVVRWVDSSGNIKTSVNMIPPCATAITAGSDASLPTSHAWTTVYQPKIKSGTIDHSLAEVAKTYHWREFGNGAGNGGTASGSYPDASMLSGTSDDIAYVMDDGLTSFGGDDVGNLNDSGAGWGGEIFPVDNGDNIYLTFIGTGIGTTNFRDGSSMGTIAQNLPYGTHTLKIYRDATSDPVVTVDGVSLGSIDINSYGGVHEITFFQPKMPPIPENAVVIADYMLMADFVPVTAAGKDKISKGVRLVSSSRDHLHDVTNGTIALSVYGADSYFAAMKQGIYVRYMDMTSEQGPQLTYFGDAKVVNEFHDNSDGVTSVIQHFDGATTNVTVDSPYTDNGAVVTSIPSSSVVHVYVYGTKTTGTMGVQTAKLLGDELGSSANDWIYHSATQVSTPIHTSSHYQSFETPFLRELVGGDRNMEQTNLVVTGDGKTWDEVTRDTSYIGNMRLHTTNDVAVGNATDAHIFDEWRGSVSRGDNFNKDFAIAYDRMICLVDGQYNISFSDYDDTNFIHRAEIWLNGVRISSSYGSLGSGYSSILLSLKRGDYLQGKGNSQTSGSMSVKHFLIERI